MKVTNVELSSENGNTFNFGLSELSETDKFIAKTIIGMDADIVTPKFYGFGLRSGRPFYNFSREKRTFVMRIVLNPNFSINESHSDIRDELYRTIAPNRSGINNLMFQAGGAAVAKASGFITKFEVPYFSNVPELQLTIDCDDAMLRGVSPVEYNTSDLGNTNPIFLGDALSTAPHGFRMQLEVEADIPSFVIEDGDPDYEDPDWRFTITPSGGFDAGDVITLSSEFGAKEAYFERDGIRTYLLGDIVPGSMWPVIYPGGNFFRITDLADLNWVSLSYSPAYWGV